MTERPGGKAVNVARVLHRLGEPTRLLAPVGGGTGEQLRDDLGRVRARRRRSSRAITATRRTVTVVEHDGAHRDDPGRAGRPRLLGRRARSRRRRARLTPTCWSISGSVPDGVPDDGLAALVTAGRRRRCRSSSTPAARGCCQPWRRAPRWSSPTPTSWRWPRATTTPSEQPAPWPGPPGRRSWPPWARTASSRPRPTGVWEARPAAALDRQPDRRRRRPGRRTGPRAAARPERGRHPELLLPTPSRSSAAAVLSPEAGRGRPRRHHLEQRAGVVVRGPGRCAMTVVGDRRPDRRGAAVGAAHWPPST